MNKVPSKSQILQLYRSLMRYGQELKLTDKAFFSQRIRSEFNRKKLLSEPQSIKTAYEVIDCLKIELIQIKMYHLFDFFH